MRLIKNDTMWNDPFAEVNRFLDRSFGSPLGLWIENLQESSYRNFPVDFLQDDDSFYVVAEMPGYAKKEISIELENAVLTISADRKHGRKTDSSTYQISRSITVGDDVNGDKVTAVLENGILTVTLPKSEQRKPRAISIA